MKSYPRDSIPRLNIGINYAQLGQFDKALAVYRNALELDPSAQLNHAAVARGFLGDNRLDEAKQILRRAFDGGMDQVTRRALHNNIPYLVVDMPTVHPNL